MNSMEKEEILNIFLERGLIIDSNTLEFFIKNQNLIEVFLEKIKGLQVPAVIKIDFVNSVLKEKVLFEEIKKDGVEKEVFSIDDIHSILIERYNRLQNFFYNRLDLVNLISINKISEKTRKFTIIGMIREIDRENKLVLIEDLTGEIRARVKEELLNLVIEDDVVAFVCEKNEEIEVVNILWPDIPFKKIIPKLEEEVLCAFLSSSIFSQDFDKTIEKFISQIKKINFKEIYIFVFSEDEKFVEKIREKLPISWKLVVITKKFSKELNDTYIFHPPTYLIFSKKIILLLINGEEIANYQKIWKLRTEEIMVNILKKRCLGKFSINKLKEDLIIDPVPDIFVSCGAGNPGMVNYKGTTVISCGSGEEKMFWILNLSSRETLRINLD